jgi:hypothetical protein
MYTFDDNHLKRQVGNRTRGRKATLVGRPGKLKGSVAALALFSVMSTTTVTPTATPTPTGTPPSTAAPTPAATPIPTATGTPAPAVTPTATPTPIAAPTVTTANASGAPEPGPGSFEQGMNRVLQAAGSAFLEFRGNLVRTENGSPPHPLFRFRKICAGTFVFGGATLAELEEVYYHEEQQPVYNYHLYFQASPGDTAERYGDLRLRLNQLLAGFVHTQGDRYDAWARADSLKTAVLLSIQDLPGSLEIQIHAAFASPQW